MVRLLLGLVGWEGLWLRWDLGVLGLLFVVVCVGDYFCFVFYVLNVSFYGVYYNFCGVVWSFFLLKVCVF